jgi:tetratricopeptide (TPR) repeat protein
MNRSYRFDLFICLVLASLTVLVYGDIFSHQFVIIDDPAYVDGNPHVQSGLTLENIKWAFTTTRAEFWHPLTWLSYMLDAQLFGHRPAAYLFTNLLLHALNAVLIFALFNAMTHDRWQSALVAALFALHPLHVESVAWVAERKDVLSCFFWLLTTGQYIRFVRNPGFNAYLLLCLALTLGLMAKPMLVTLPFVLLLLDYWPLNRFPVEKTPGANRTTAIFLVREKIPLFILAAVFSLTTALVQKAGGGISSAAQYPVADRIWNAIIAYAVYAGKMIWPQKLAVFYPFPDTFPAWKVAAAAILLIGITTLAIRSARSHPFFIVGWLWYLGTLVPVIGLVKIGDFSMADRYMYIPLIGLAIIAAWGAAALLTAIPRKKIALTAVSLTVLAGLSWASFWQVKTWANSFTLLNHALEVTENNFYAHYGLGHAYAGRGQFAQAVIQFSRAIQINPAKATLYNDLGRCLAGQGRFKDARIQFENAHAINPRHPAAHYYLANIFLIQNQFPRSIYHFSEALRFRSNLNGNAAGGNPETVLDYHQLVSKYALADRRNRAIDHNQNIREHHPENLEALRRLMIAYSVKGEYQRAFALIEVETAPEKRRRDIVRGYADWKPVP